MIPAKLPTFALAFVLLCALAVIGGALFQITTFLSSIPIAEAACLLLVATPLVGSRTKDLRPLVKGLVGTSVIFMAALALAHAVSPMRIGLPSELIMPPESAAAFLLAGFAILLPWHIAPYSIAAEVAAGIVFVIGAIGCVARLSFLGQAAGTSDVFRMSGLSGVTLMLLAIGLLCAIALRSGWTWMLGRSVTICLCCGVLGLLAVCGLSLRALTLFASTTDTVARSFAVKASVGDLQRELLDAVSSRRAFLDTQDADLVEKYREAMGRARIAFEKLRELASDGEQSIKVQDIERFFLRQLERFERNPGAAPAGPATPANRSQASTREFIALLSGITNEEDRRLISTQSKARHDLRLAAMVIPAGAAVSIALLCASIILLNQEARQRHSALQVLKVSQERLQESEQRYKALNDELEGRIARRTAQLEESNNELEAFSYSVSHDLRAPLRHIQGYVDLLQRNLTAPVSEKAVRYIKTITDSSVEMGQLIDDLLEFSRMGRIELRRDRVKLNLVVQETIGSLEMAIRDRSIQWKVEELPEVIGDYAMLRQVFANLISNAVKYTRGKAPAVIEVGRGQKDGNVVIFVRDNGAGFDMKYLDKLFGVFQRLHRADEFEGTGIGLATVRRIVTRHGGTVWAEGTIGAGATFYLTLPPSTSLTQ